AIAVSVCRGQQVSDEPFKGATKIVVACNDSELDLYTRWGKHLAMKGFGIDESNPDFLQLVTKPKDTSKLNFSYTLITTVDENVVHIAIQWRLNSSFLAGTNETSF